MTNIFLLYDSNSYGRFDHERVCRHAIFHRKWIFHPSFLFDRFCVVSLSWYYSNHGGRAWGRRGTLGPPFFGTYSQWFTTIVGTAKVYGNLNCFNVERDNSKLAYIVFTPHHTLSAFTKWPDNFYTHIKNIF